MMSKQPFKIGSHILTHGLFLAPMAGFTDRAMRHICHRFGAEVSVSEMISAKALLFSDRKTLALSRIEAEDGPTVLQIFGKEPDTIARGIEKLTATFGETPPIGIDINMGCPVPKIFKNGEGSALMASPSLIEQIVRAAKGATSLPISVKLRLGIDDAHRNAVECALAAEAGGADFVAIHGRTRVQMYSGVADWESIKNVKCALQIPVIANGDITSGEQAKAILHTTGADGIMVGRAAIGNPFLFRDILCALEDTPYTPPSLEEKIEVAKEELSIAISDKGEELAVREARGKIALYLHSFHGASALRARVHTARTFMDVSMAFDEALRLSDAAR